MYCVYLIYEKRKTQQVGGGREYSISEDLQAIICSGLGIPRFPSSLVLLCCIGCVPSNRNQIKKVFYAIVIVVFI